MSESGIPGDIEIAVADEPVAALRRGTLPLVSQAASISKQLMAVVVLQLVEERRLGLADTVGRWWPAAPPVWTGITVHQLLTHTSGLGHWQDVDGLDLDAVTSRAELDALIAVAPPVAAPGRRFSYSGIGYLALAAVAEAADGRVYGDLVADRVLRPAGMAASSSGRRRAGDPDVAAGTHGGEPVAVNPVLTELPGTGDLWTTTGDLLAFAAALHDGRLLAPASRQAMTTRHTSVPATRPPGPVDATGYGYGTFLGTVAGRAAQFHPGDNPGYTSLLARLPEQQLDVAVLCHDDEPPLGPVVDRVVRQALDAAGP